MADAHLTTITHGLHPRILQVPLDGGEAKIGRLDPDYYIGLDSHRYFTLSARLLLLADVQPCNQCTGIAFQPTDKMTT
jgi:hypothetical protein